MLRKTKIEQQSELSAVEKACYAQYTYYLQHKTSIEYLPDIFKNGFLTPRSQQKLPKTFLGGSGEVVYLQPYKYRHALETTVEEFSGDEYDFDMEEETGSISRALLLFSVNLLEERDDYFANRAWSYGLKDKNSVTAQQLKLNSYASIGSYGELCFSHSIDLSKHLIAVWVHPIKLKCTMDLMQEKQIDSTFILSSYTFHPEIKLQNNIDLHLINRDLNNNAPSVDAISSNLYRFFSPDKKEEIPNKVDIKSLKKVNSLG